MGKTDPASAAKSGSAFTLRLDADLTAKVSGGCDALEKTQGFRLSRNQFIEWVLRRHFDSVDSPPATQEAQPS